MKIFILTLIFFVILSCVDTNYNLNSKLIREFANTQFFKYKYKLNRMGKNDFIYPEISQLPSSIRQLKPKKIILTKLGLYFVQKNSTLGGERGIFVSIKNIKPRKSSTTKYIHIDNQVYIYTIKFD